MPNFAGSIPEFMFWNKELQINIMSIKKHSHTRNETQHYQKTNGARDAKPSTPTTQQRGHRRT